MRKRIRGREKAAKLLLKGSNCGFWLLTAQLELTYPVHPHLCLLKAIIVKLVLLFAYNRLHLISWMLCDPSFSFRTVQFNVDEYSTSRNGIALKLYLIYT